MMVETADTLGAVSLWEALRTVPDHRRAEGKRYPMPSLLLIAVAAMLTGRPITSGFRRSQPVIPTETSHLFRLKPATHSDGSQPGWRYGLRTRTFGVFIIGSAASLLG
jgi:hypothetical protein